MTSLADLERSGRYLSTLDGRVFVKERGEGGTPLVVLHGFPTSCHDFDDAIAELARDRRVLTFDFLGYGLSDKPGHYSYSLMAQTDLALAVLRDAGITRAHVWAHDMGTSVATELCARRERGLLGTFELASLTLMNGSVHVELADLTFGQHLLRSPLGGLFARFTNERTFGLQMRRIFGKPVADEKVHEMWELLAREGGARVMPKLIGYVGERYAFWDRWIGALRRLDVPTLVAWGELDPVAVMPIARALAAEIPGARLQTWPDLGHYPQVEEPARVAATVAAFLSATRSGGPDGEGATKPAGR
ncbi:MAG: alpha/beta hydrolase [Myxococcales bacterium]|nr:alpha/beta hydrolase [Myxococcales bacterium]